MCALTLAVLSGVCVRAGAPLGGGGVPGTPRTEAVRRPTPDTRLYCEFPEYRTLAPTNFSLESHQTPT